MLQKTKNLSLAMNLTSAKIFTWTIIIVYIIFFSFVTVSRHNALETHAYDLVNMDQAIWSTLQGDLLGISIPTGGDTRLAWHFEPILIPISLLYFIYDGAETLLILQTIIIALGALPVYWLSRDKFDNEWIGSLFALLYLLYPTVQAGNNFDFHAVTLAAPFLLFAIYGIESKNRLMAIVFCILAMSTKEEIPLLVFMLSGYTFIFKDKKLGVVLSILAIIWFIIGFKIIIPYFNVGDGSHYNARYRIWGDTQGEMLSNIVTNPDKVWRHLTSPTKIKYYQTLLFPFAFLSLLAPHWLILAAPSLAINLLSNESGQSLADEYHYPSPITPFVIVSAIIGSSWLIKRLSQSLKIDKKILLGTLLILLLTTSMYQQFYRGFSPISPSFYLPKQTEHDRIGLELINQIPTDAAVSAQSDLAPHLSHRENIYLFPEKLDKADYILLDVTSIIFPISSYPQYQEAIKTALSSGFVIANSQDGYLLLEKGDRERPLTTDFFSFMLAENDLLPQNNITATFADGIHFFGFDINQKRNSTLELQTFWYLDKTPPPDAEIQLNIAYNDGIGSRTIQPITTAWLPMNEWPLNTFIVVDFADFGLAPNPDSEINLSLEVTTNSGLLPIEEIKSPYSYQAAFEKNGTALNLINYCYKNTILFDCNVNRTYEIPSSSHIVDMSFNEAFNLSGYNINSQSFQSGEEINLNLYWRKDALLETNTNIFVHVTSTNPWEIFTQDDQTIWKESYPNDLWEQSEIVFTEHKLTLPKDNMSPGVYVIRLGLYDPDTGERMYLEDHNMVNDHIELINIEIRD